MASTESSRSFADLSPSSSWTNQSSSPFGPEKKPSTVTISEATIRLKSPPCRRCTDLFGTLTADAPETHRRLARGRSCPHRNPLAISGEGRPSSREHDPEAEATLRRQGLAASVDTGRRDGRARLRRYP